MGYRDLDRYRPDLPAAPPPAPPRPSRGGPGRRALPWLLLAALAVAATAWRLHDPDTDPLGSARGTGPVAAQPLSTPSAPTPGPAASIRVERSFSVPTQQAPGATPVRAPSASPQASSDAAQAVAWQFAHAWAHPDWTASRWRNALTPLTSTDLARQLDTVDPRNVPATTIVAITRQASTENGQRFLVVTDGPRLQVDVQQTAEGQWRVTALTSLGHQPPSASPAATTGSPTGSRN